jgi:PTS system mannose-specific IIA component
MIGILLITHGTFGESLIQNICHVLNKRPPLIASSGSLRRMIRSTSCQSANVAAQGGRRRRGGAGDDRHSRRDAANLALKLLDPGRIEGVAGVSLPMLLRALTYRKNGMETLMQKAISGGHDGVINMHRH